MRRGGIAGLAGEAPIGLGDFDWPEGLSWWGVKVISGWANEGAALGFGIEAGSEVDED